MHGARGEEGGVNRFSGTLGRMLSGGVRLCVCLCNLRRHVRAPVVLLRLLGSRWARACLALALLSVRSSHTFLLFLLCAALQRMLFVQLVHLLLRAVDGDHLLIRQRPSDHLLNPLLALFDCLLAEDPPAWPQRHKLEHPVHLPGGERAAERRLVAALEVALRGGLLGGGGVAQHGGGGGQLEHERVLLQGRHVLQARGHRGLVQLFLEQRVQHLLLVVQMAEGVEHHAVGALRQGLVRQPALCRSCKLFFSRIYLLWFFLCIHL
mmetsp:Transcript_15892/g.34469  ORF Transcript_15892/g.34469 Transcript_15892/m.34469 type:complete len:265 (-) Transcript_15892:373-1167(-)